MDTYYKFIMVLLFVFMWLFIRVNHHNINQIENQLQNYHIVESECEAILSYRQFAQPQLLCYMGDDHSYTANERRVINQWKSETIK